jgi:hypothetical protein
LQVAALTAPTQVQKGDLFEVRALVQGQTMAGRSVEVTLSRTDANADQTAVPLEIETKTAVLQEDGVPEEVVFKIPPEKQEVGDYRYIVDVKPTVAIVDQNADDNKKVAKLRITDEPLRVLIVAGGPMRDYRFVRNMLYRHSGVETDVWLQTIEKGDASSQEANRLLYAFPTREELLGNDEYRGYDVIIAFDPDWEALSPENVKLIHDFVYEHAGGLMLVAGDVYTPELARARERSAGLDDILALYPVVLNSPLEDLADAYKADQPWKPELTPVGKDVSFLQVSDDPQESRDVWGDFAGFHRCYPTEGKKAGALIYAYFTDPEAQNEYGKPIIMASQFYGSGRTLYLGVPELWRLRALDEEYYDRLWTNAVRELGQTRQKRGGARGTLLTERQRYTIGQTVRVRANLLDQLSNPLIVESVEVDVTDPKGRPLLPKRVLRHDANRPGQYVGTFRVDTQGSYELALSVPESTDVLTAAVEVSLPRLEFAEQRQDTQALKMLADETTASYFSLTGEDAPVVIADADKGLPGIMPYKGQEFLVNETVRELWDKSWLLGVIVALLGIEWLTRKLLKLA